MDNNLLNNDPATPKQLLSLPDELLIQIMTFVMKSNVPVYFWLFRNLAQYIKLYAFWETDYMEFLRHDQPPYDSNAWLPYSQREHLLDWLSTTGTCRRLRSCGQPAFFSEKIFGVPPTMLRALHEGALRTANSSMAAAHVKSIVVPVSGFVHGTDFMALPRCHHFTRLNALTIRVTRAPVCKEDLIEGCTHDRVWPQVPPEELLKLLSRLGLRVDDLMIHFVIVDEIELGVPVTMQKMEQGVYPLLRTLIRRRAKRCPPL